MIAALCELYPVETTAYTAKVVGMSETAVKNKAKELGIVKIAKPLWMERAALKNMNEPSGRAVKGVHEEAYL